MLVHELIEQLKRFDPMLPVYGYCDHGQTPEKISPPGIIFVKEASHSVWDGEWADNRQDAKQEGYNVKAVIL
jgi:hypothetical protein